MKNITKMTFGHQLVSTYKRLNYSLWHALSEFLDNSTQAAENFKKQLSIAFKNEKEFLKIKIDINYEKKTISISDNAIGMDEDELKNSLKNGRPTNLSKGRSKYGLGLKTASFWLGKEWSVTTTKLGSGKKLTCHVSEKKIAVGNDNIEIISENVSKKEHGTSVKISSLNRRLSSKTEALVREFLGAMFRFDIRDKKLALYLNNTVVRTPDDWVFAKISGANLAKEKITTKINGKKVSGWIGVLEKGQGTSGRKFGGFSLFKHGRQIRGFPDAWKPASIFGGVAGEGANGTLAQRLCGEIILNDFDVTHTKDNFNWQDNEEELIECFLAEKAMKYKRFVNSIKNSGASEPWNDDKLKEVCDEASEDFKEDEYQEFFRNPSCPSISAIEKSDANHLKNKSYKDYTYKIDSIKGLNIKINFSTRSENDQHFIFHEIKNNELVICINKLHPYFHEIDDSSRVQEIIKQYLFDALAEHLVSKNDTGRVDSKAIRYQKDKLMRAKIEILNRKDLEHTKDGIKSLQKESRKINIKKNIKNKVIRKKKK